MSADRGKSHGPAVVAGVLQYTSPSALAKSDPESDGGCPRKAYYRYVERISEGPPSKGQQVGTEVHAQIEEALVNGATPLLGPIAMAARPWFPVYYAYKVEGAMSLVVDDVPVIGYKDLVDYGREHLDGEGELVTDPEGTVEVLDWKTTRDFRYVKTPHEMAATVQMVTYGRDEVVKGALHVRLSHVYLKTQGAAKSRKSTLLLPADEINRRWQRVEGLVRKLKVIAAAPCAADVEANTASCSAMGGCAYRSICPAGGEKSLVDLFGAGTALSLSALVQGATGEGMSLKDLITNTTPAAVSLSMAEELAKLEAEEAAVKTPTYDVAFAAACEAVESAKKGFPTLSDAAAHAWCAWKGCEFQGSGLSGSGLLARLTLRTVEQMAQLAKELGVTPVETPAATLKNPTAQEVGVQLETVARTEADVVAVLPPDAPESDPALASKAPEAPPDPTAAFVPPEKAKRSKKKSTGEQAADAAVDAARATNEVQFAAAHGNPPGVPQEDPPVATCTPRGITLYINCIPSTPCESLDTYVDKLASALCQRYGAADLRCAPEQSPLGFGKWRGALAALARECPPPAGEYVIDTRGRDLHEVVADALATKGEVVRGIR